MEQPTISPSKLWYLKHIKLFSGLSQAELQEMDRITRMQEIKKKQPIYLPGDPANTVYLLKKGRVKIASSASSGKEVTFEILEAGEIFGELEVLEDSPRETHAEALDDALICAIRREDFDRYLSEHPDLSVKLTKLIGLRLRKIQTRVEDLVFRDAPARLAHLLLELSKTDGAPEGAGLRLHAKLTHQEMANLIGCSRETVSTILGQFREQGLIRIDGRSIIVLNPHSLSRLLS
jgi:CRP-like cAMP-binding protein